MNYTLSADLINNSDKISYLEYWTIDKSKIYASIDSCIDYPTNILSYRSCVLLLIVMMIIFIILYEMNHKGTLKNAVLKIKRFFVK